MILQAYSIYDVKALQYHTPFFASTDGAAVRSFADLANDLNTMVGRHPSDFVLYRVGHYDDATAEVKAVSPLVHIIDASALLRIQPKLPLEVAQNG